MKHAAQGSKQNEFTTGWRVLLAATVGCGLGAASLPAASFGTFIVPLSDEFGWTRGEISMGLLFMTLGLALTAPFVGMLIDRFGLRAVVLTSIPLLTLSFLGLATMTGAIAIFYACFASTMILGGGTVPISYSRAVNEAFDRYRGMALGVMFAGVGVAAAILPVFSTAVTVAMGWRVSYLALGLLALVSLPFVLFGMPKREDPVADQVEKTVTRAPRQYLRSRTFYTIAIGCSLASFASYGLLVHFIPLLMDEGLSATEAANYAALIGAAGVAGRLLIGFLIDRIFAPYVGALVLVATACGCVLFIFAGLPASMALAVLIGFSFGMEVDLLAFLVARYFGIRHYGQIYGMIYSCFAIGAALGPAVDGFIHDVSGSYDYALWMSAGVLILSAVTMLTLPRYGKGEEPVAG